MEILKTINLTLITILVIAAGVPKLMSMEHEVQFFSDVGLGTWALIPFGVIQSIGGILMALPSTRRVGAITSAVMLALSTLMLLVNGQTAMAGFSCVTVVMATLVLFGDWRNTAFKTH